MEDIQNFFDNFCQLLEKLFDLVKKLVGSKSDVDVEADVSAVLDAAEDGVNMDYSMFD